MALFSPARAGRAHAPLMVTSSRLPAALAVRPGSPIRAPTRTAAAMRIRTCALRKTIATTAASPTSRNCSSQNQPQIAGNVGRLYAEGIRHDQPALGVDQEAEGRMVDPIAHGRVFVFHLFDENAVGVQDRLQVFGAGPQAIK